MTDPSYAVIFRGRPACPCQVEWLLVLEAEAQRRGLITGRLPISQLIGTYGASAGTHAGGGATDFYPLNGVERLAGEGGFIWLCRQMGADATWVRPYDWDHEGGVEHAHSVLRGCSHNGPAAYQIDAVDDGFNGLGTGGRGAPDDGPRPLSGRTWREGIEWAKEQEDEMADPKVQEQLDRIEQAAAKTVKMLDNQRERQRTQTARLREKLDRAIATGQATKVELEAMRAELVDED